MPKRVGYLYEKVITFDNCFAAVLEATRSVRQTDLVKDIRNRPYDYAHKVLNILKEGWKPGGIRFRILNEGPTRKERKLIISSTIDHIIHVAIMRVAQPLFLNRFDYYSCGSIKGRGQNRCFRALKGWMKNKRYKYAAECDVYHFYDKCHPDVVLRLMRKFIKDEKYLGLHKLILDQMYGIGIEVKNESDRPFKPMGIAIGFSPSHWYANLVLTECDRTLREKCKGVKFVRYMDNYALISNRKRRLHNAVHMIEQVLHLIKLKLKDDWQVFLLKDRPIKFLSFRYAENGTVIISKRNLFRISRKAGVFKKNPGAFNARSFMSKIGLLKNSDTYSFEQRYIFNRVSMSLCRFLISSADTKER